MKTLICLLAIGLGCAIAAEPAKLPLTLTAKQRVVDAEHDLRGKKANAGHKWITLRVEILNSSQASVTESKLSGNVLVMREGNAGGKVIKKSLGAVDVPAMKPNERLTLDLGKVELSEFEGPVRKIEETLEEWQVVCTADQTVIGKAASSDRYAALEAQIQPPDAKKQGRKKR